MLAGSAVWRLVPVSQAPVRERPAAHPGQSRLPRAFDDALGLVPRGEPVLGAPSRSV